jgi:hypothetical protein
MTLEVGDDADRLARSGSVFDGLYARLSAGA